ncbi:Rne/Rng family ribonuclease [Rhodopseudomonas sp. HC1]|uniref:Rne/Rng family ribonuclease n=1 Tax=Rhodopseudomonas infernalis TaxID=2897386 RepID=UPI001EE8E8FB|nr:ribonuclease E/G [Rhodopseudomonas infernalis]MCG6203527.1 Rne/Rng family ribonuclease [Rhodopseudomonas infernalis]
MPNKMLIDATHPEETRVVVVRGNRVEEFDFETAQRKQLRGNIYLAKVTRVEPSLQAAFIEYGGNRHGFLAFSEIHPDYYQIPVADRQALIEADERAHREAEEESEQRSTRRRSRHRSHRRRGSGERVQSEVVDADPSAEQPHDHEHNGSDQVHADHDHGQHHDHDQSDHAHTEHNHTDHNDADHQRAADAPLMHESPAQEAGATPETSSTEFGNADGQAGEQSSIEHHNQAEAVSAIVAEAPANAEPVEVAAPAAADHVPHDQRADELGSDEHVADDNSGYAEDAPFPLAESAEHDQDEDDHAHAEHAEAEAEDDVEADGDDDEDDDDEAEEDIVESVGGDDVLEEVPERAFRPRRQYKIQEVIKRRQVMLVQVVKEERGNKGAALTTYLSLAGRYAVLMPNTARGGGISRKITSAQDRSRLKEVVQDLDVPEGMGIILRTAGATRTKPEIKRDFEYLIRMWETVRDVTLNSQAPTLVYEEGSLIKRSLRDLYNKEIDEIQVAGEAGYQEARDFMHMLMPSQVRAVKLYRDGQPLFSRMGVESQLDAMFSPTVQLRSGGYIVINQTEALVSIDVNSGRSTREHHIEDTALKTNLEASEEVARQLRLRDLAGLIVIDFIDMDEKRNNRAVERKLSDCLRQDRARIQVGRISHFGLLEMSRQRIRASVLESSTEPCPHCGGSGHVRSVSSVALQLLRGLEEILMKGATHNLIVRTRADVALYVLNQKRGHLRDLETGFKVSLSVVSDPTVSGQQSFVIDRGEQVHTLEAAKALLAAQVAASPPQPDEPYADDEGYEFEAEIETDETVGLADEQSGESSEGEGGERKRKRRRRRRSRNGEGRDASAPTEDGEPSSAPEAGEAESAADEEGDDTEDGAEGEGEARADQANGERRPRRRGRRGGRRRRGGPEGEESAAGGSDEFGATDQADENHAEPDGESHGEAAPLSPASESSAEPWLGKRHEQDSEAEDASAPSASAAETAELHVEKPALTAIASLTATAESVPAPAEAAPAEETAAERSARRRSTVREKVNFGATAPKPDVAASPATEETPAPAEPAALASESAPQTAAEPASEAPRRAGWWSRRFGGGGN